MSPSRPTPKTILCPGCGGRGVRAVGTEDVHCDACDGKGRIPK